VPPIPGFRGKVMVSMRQSYGLSHTLLRSSTKLLNTDMLSCISSEKRTFWTTSDLLFRPYLPMTAEAYGEIIMT